MKRNKRAILLADDHAVFRAGLGQLLTGPLQAGRLVEVSDFNAALEKLDDPDLFLAVFDLGMPGLESPLQLEAVRRQRPDVRVVVVSGDDDRQQILKALTAGVHGYILKTTRVDQMLARFEKILDGEISVPANLAQLPAVAACELQDEQPFVQALTERQFAVLGLLADGRSNKEIARELGIAEGTVKMHISVLFRAINVTNRTQAAAVAKRIKA